MPYQPDVSMAYVVSKPDTSMPYTMQVKLTPVCHVIPVSMMLECFKSCWPLVFMSLTGQLTLVCVLVNLTLVCVLVNLMLGCHVCHVDQPKTSVRYTICLASQTEIRVTYIMLSNMIQLYRACVRACVRMCVRACVRACVWVRVRACVHVCEFV